MIEKGSDAIAIDFINRVTLAIFNSLKNYYPYDRNFYGKEKFNIYKIITYNLLYRKFVNRNLIIETRKSFEEEALNHLSNLNWVYNNLNDEESRTLFIELLCLRILGSSRYRLSLDNKAYWNERKELRYNRRKINKVHGNNKLPFKLWLHDLKYINYKIRLYQFEEAIQDLFYRNQYQYLTDNNNVKVELGDSVIDGGACYGDSALYFANLVGPSGRVISIEFVPSNIEVFRDNCDLNPVLASRISLQTYALSNTDDSEITYHNYGPGSRITNENDDTSLEKAQSITLDKLFDDLNLKKINYIKLDIEGCELEALKGSINVIKSFRPKMAIAVYHKKNDIFEIPQWINALGLGYRFFLGHYTVGLNETILYAKVIE